VTFKPLQLTGTRGRILGPDLNDETLHYNVCEVCSQAYDVRIFDLVLYHSQPEHKPVRLDG
jgi:hypothetical protein